MGQVKEKASTKNKPVRDIVSESKIGLDQEGFCLMPTDNAIEQRISRVRKPLRNDGLDNKSLSEFIVPDEFKTMDGQGFLVYDSQNEGKIVEFVIFFAQNPLLKLLSN